MFYFVGPNMSRDITIGLCGGRMGNPILSQKRLRDLLWDLDAVSFNAYDRILPSG